MKILKAYKFKLKTNRKLTNQLQIFAGHTRFVWNKALALNLNNLKNKTQIMYYQELDFWSKLWKKSNEYGFLRECPSQTIQQKLKDLEKAFRDCFDKKQPNKKLPRFKKRGCGDSFRYPQGFKIDANKVFLPKIGWVRFFKSCEIIGTPKNVTVSKHNGSWYISVQVELNVENPVHPSKSMLGIDMGIVNFATTSLGEHVNPVNSFKKYSKQLRLAQRSMSRKVKFSSNWQKAKRRVQHIHSKIANVRRDFLHKTSTRLSKNHAVIVMEDLKVANMSKSACGDIENPGTNVKAKSGLNKSILDQGWHEFKRQLQYKQQWSGGDVILVSPKHTSQTCPNSNCNHKSKQNRKSQSEFACEKCGYKNNADIVGALNVLAAGHAVLACGDIPKGDKIGSIGNQAQESPRAAA